MRTARLNRRGFLRALLGGAAALTVGQRRQVEEQLRVAELDESVDGVELVAGEAGSLLPSGLPLAEIGAPLITWLPPVATARDLPLSPAEADGVFVEDTDQAYVYVADVGWVALFASALGPAEDHDA